jgi:hypothetical protein
LIALEHQVFVVIDDRKITDGVAWVFEFVITDHAHEFLACQIKLVNSQCVWGVTQDRALEHQVEFGFARVDRHVFKTFGGTEVGWRGSARVWAAPCQLSAPCQLKELCQLNQARAFRGNTALTLACQAQHSMRALEVARSVAGVSRKEC